MKEGAYLKRDHHWHFAYFLEAEKYNFLAEAIIFLQGAQVKVMRPVAEKNDTETITELLLYGTQNVREVTRLNPYLMTKPSQERIKTNWQSVLSMLKKPERIDEQNRELIWEALILEFPKDAGIEAFQIERIKKIRSMMGWGLRDSKSLYDALEAEYDK